MAILNSKKTKSRRRHGLDKKRLRKEEVGMV